MGRGVSVFISAPGRDPWPAGGDLYIYIRDRTGDAKAPVPRHPILAEPRNPYAWLRTPAETTGFFRRGFRPNRVKAATWLASFAQTGAYRLGRYNLGQPRGFP